MKKSTSIHEEIFWRGKIFRCPHQLGSGDVIAILSAASKSSEGFKDAQYFVKRLRKIGGGWPHYRGVDLVFISAWWRSSESLN